MRKQIISDKYVVKSFHIWIAVFALLCILPFLTMISISFSSEREVAVNGFSILPVKPTISNYQYIFMNKGSMLINAYGITIFTAIIGTLFSLTVTTCYAYAASIRKFRFANTLSFIAWFTMIFNGGLLPWYILVTKYYHLKNTLFALFVPYGMNVFYMFILRNAFKAVPLELMESAKIDGAGNFRVFVSIMIPMAKVGIVTVTLFYVLLYWNDFFLPMMLISESRLYPMQMVLYAMESNIQFITSGSAKNIGSAGADAIEVPLITARMAMTCIAVAPILLFYPFAQKYFVKGMIVGAIKG